MVPVSVPRSYCLPCACRHWTMQWIFPQSPSLSVVFPSCESLAPAKLRAHPTLTLASPVSKMTALELTFLHSSWAECNNCWFNIFSAISRYISIAGVLNLALHTGLWRVCASDFFCIESWICYRAAVSLTFDVLTLRLRAMKKKVYYSSDTQFPVYAFHIYWKINCRLPSTIQVEWCMAIIRLEKLEITNICEGRAWCTHTIVTVDYFLYQLVDQLSILLQLWWHAMR